MGGVNGSSSSKMKPEQQAPDGQPTGTGTDGPDATLTSIESRDALSRALQPLSRLGHADVSADELERLCLAWCGVNWWMRMTTEGFRWDMAKVQVVAQHFAFVGGSAPPSLRPAAVLLVRRPERKRNQMFLVTCCCTKNILGT